MLPCIIKARHEMIERRAAFFFYVPVFADARPSPLALRVPRELPRHGKSPLLFINFSFMVMRGDFSPDVRECCLYLRQLLQHYHTPGCRMPGMAP